MTSTPDYVLSVLVVALNEERHIGLLMDALTKLAMPEHWRFETILVDGGSRDGTVELARAKGFDACLVHPGASIPVCRNLALRAARGHVFAFLDADCLPEPDWFRQALPWLLKEEPVMLGYPVQPPPAGNWIQRTWHAHWRHKHSVTAAADPEPVTRDAFRLITTRNMLFNRALLDVVPEFDEALSTGEDTDFAFRATQAGCRVVALPALRVTHLGEPSTLRQYYRQQLWHANRKAYATIFRSTRGASGANAVFYTLAFLAALLLVVPGLILALLSSPWYALLLAPIVLIPALPALLIADRANSPILFFQLTVLYFLYGLARSVDLLGLSPRKYSWKK